MANLKLLLLVCVVTVGDFGLGQQRVDPQPIPPQPSSSSEPPPTVPTTKASTTKVPPTPPAPNSTTTSTTPSTTTTSTTTTVAPTTPTTSKPTTPAPAPTPKVANWTVNYPDSNRTCIILSVAAQFIIPINETNKTSIYVTVPSEATSSGSCNTTDKQTLVLSWGQNNSVEFDFVKTKSKHFDLSVIIATLNVSTGTGYEALNLVHNKSEFTAPLENSYKCDKSQSLDLTQDGSNRTVATLDVSHLQYQAFRNSTEQKFDSALDCNGSLTPDVVPIVVGCVLAVLVVAVLVAYLFGRRRCQARGYLSIGQEE